MSKPRGARAGDRGHTAAVCRCPLGTGPAAGRGRSERPLVIAAPAARACGGVASPLGLRWGAQWRAGCCRGRWGCSIHTLFAHVVMVLVVVVVVRRQGLSREGKFPVSVESNRCSHFSRRHTHCTHTGRLVTRLTSCCARRTDFGIRWCAARRCFRGTPPLQYISTALPSACCCTLRPASGLLSVLITADDARRRARARARASERERECVCARKHSLRSWCGERLPQVASPWGRRARWRRRIRRIKWC